MTPTSVACAYVQVFLVSPRRSASPGCPRGALQKTRTCVRLTVYDAGCGCRPESGRAVAQDRARVGGAHTIQCPTCGAALGPRKVLVGVADDPCPIAAGLLSESTVWAVLRLAWAGPTVPVCVRQHPTALSAPSSSDQRARMANRDDQPLRGLEPDHYRRSGLKDAVSHHLSPAGPLTSTAPQAFPNNLTMPSQRAARRGLVQMRNVSIRAHTRHPTTERHTMTNVPNCPPPPGWINASANASSSSAQSCALPSSCCCSEMVSEPSSA